MSYDRESGWGSLLTMAFVAGSYLMGYTSGSSDTKKQISDQLLQNEVAYLRQRVEENDTEEQKRKQWNKEMNDLRTKLGIKTIS